MKLSLSEKEFSSFIESIARGKLTDREKQANDLFKNTILTILKFVSYSRYFFAVEREIRQRGSVTTVLFFAKDKHVALLPLGRGKNKVFD